MSASTERLVEQIRACEAAIASSEAQGLDASSLKSDLKQLQRKLQVASEALTEGKQILKG